MKPNGSSVALLAAVAVLSRFLSICSAVPNELPHSVRRSHLVSLRSSTPSADQASAVEGLLGRLIPDQADLFSVNVDPSIGPSDKDTFKVVSYGNGSKVVVTGTSGVAASWGILHYLKYYCNAHVSWEADQLDLPSPLPAAQIEITSNDKFRYYQNVCTVSYSMAWWDWDRWEREIDWMALNGFNLPLAFTAQEAIWQRVYTQLNLTQDDLDQHFAGPAFLAWGRMGNIRGWGGPLPQSWHDQRLQLQHKILQRMRQFGMVPVLPGFAGHVPEGLQRVFPTANVTQLGGWNGFGSEYCCTFLLDPQDPLFKTIGRMFIQEMEKEYNGTDHFYNCDTFNEMTPSSGDPDYLSSVGSAIYESMTDADPDAIWVMQGWLFLSEFWTKNRAKALLTSVPKGKMLVLDLATESNPQYNRLESYFGQPFIFNMLHNYGGVNGLFGTSTVLLQHMDEARNFPNVTLEGTGITPEGINQNYVMYDLMNELSWRNKDFDLEQWITDYATRRYGLKEQDANIEAAWKKLLWSVYDSRDPSFRHHGTYILTRTPTLELQPLIWYDVTDVVDAFSSFMEVNSTSTLAQATFRHDLTDVARQILQISFGAIYEEIVEAYYAGELINLSKLANDSLILLDDLDELLGSSPDFLLGTWLRDAKAWATNDQERKLYEYNARNQISLWGPNGEIHDYAMKQWNGLTSDYIRPRWALFYQMLIESLESGTSFDQDEYNRRVLDEVETPFTKDDKVYPDTPKGDVFAAAKKVLEKHTDILRTSSPKKQHRDITSNEIPLPLIEDPLMRYPFYQEKLRKEKKSLSSKFARLLKKFEFEGKYKKYWEQTLLRNVLA